MKKIKIPKDYWRPIKCKIRFNWKLYYKIKKIIIKEKIRKIMSKLYCEYDHSNPKVEIADHKCDRCGKLLCKICGYTTDEGVQFCNECWELNEKQRKELIKKVEEGTELTIKMYGKALKKLGKS